LNLRPSYEAQNPEFKLQYGKGKGKTERAKGKGRKKSPQIVSFQRCKLIIHLCEEAIPDLPHLLH
jgi:hypothetical protein